MSPSNQGPVTALRFGVGLRPEHFDAFRDRADAGDLQVDFLEIVSENFFCLAGESREILARLKEQVPILPHGVALSIGGPDPLDEEYLTRLEALVKFLDPPWVSDHLCYSSAYGTQYHDLLPLPHREETLRLVIPRLLHLQERLGRPFILENPTSYLELPGGEMSEGEFLAELVRQSGCGLLLDVNNIHVNARNNGRDPGHVIGVLPPGCVRQYHTAGHTAREGILIDTHGAPIDPEVDRLLSRAVDGIGPGWVTIERDLDIPSLEDLLAELGRVRLAAGRGVADEGPGSHPAKVRTPRESIDLDQVQAEFHQVLTGRKDPAELAGRWGADPTRLRLYRNFVRRHITEIIEDLFPVLLESLGEEDRQVFLETFVKDCPLARPVLRENGERVPAHLLALHESGRIAIQPWQLELAELEWALTRTLMAPEIPVGGGSLELNPTLELFRFEHPVARFFLPAAEPFDPAGPDPGWVMVWRHPTDHRPHLALADDGLLMAFKMVHDGSSPEDVARGAGGDLGLVIAHLDRAIAQGVVIGTRS